MKEIKMHVSRLGNKSWFDDGVKTFYRVSRWIKVREKYNPGKNNRLWDFVEDENGYKPYQDSFSTENGLYLRYFVFRGKTYAIEQFYCLGNPFYMPVSYYYEDNEGKYCYLSGIDMYGDLYKPIYIEMSECCEYVRVYEEV